MINLLIRTHNRDTEFKKCIQSISGQTFKDINVIVAADSQESLHYASRHLKGFPFPSQIVPVENGGPRFSWNLYCNTLKEKVTAGWFMYLDDDDWLCDRICLKRLTTALKDPKEGIICQFFRGSQRKPNPKFEHLRKGYFKPEAIIRGKIGGSAIVLHHSHKNLAHWDGEKAADYRFIKAVAEKIPLRFVPIPVVQAGNNGRHGK
jgi:glycosyltransferase involved in cell wall biosynthesis